MPGLKGTQRLEYFSVTHNIMVLILLYAGWIIQQFGLFLPLSINTHHSAVWPVPGHRTVDVTQAYVLSLPLVGLVATLANWNVQVA